jgi:hypothetical protein
MRYLTGQIPDRVLRLMPKEERKPMGKAGVTSAEAQEKQDDRSERELQNQMENWFRLNGIPAFRQRMDKKSNMPKGTPDFLCCVDGWFVAFEVKIGSNTTTLEQMNCLASINHAKGCARVVFSLDGVKKTVADLRMNQPGVKVSIEGAR